MIEQPENIETVEIITPPPIKKYYTEKHRQAQQRYRNKNRDKYNEFQRELYEKLHNSEEWRTKFNERSKKNNLIYRNKKKEQLLTNPDYKPKTKGRPRKDKQIENLYIDVIKQIGIIEHNEPNETI